MSAAGIDDVGWAPHILAMCEAAAADRGVAVQDVFRGGVHMISPLKLAKEEASVFQFFTERGLRVGVGCMTSAGGSAPVTLAGAMTVHLAQVLFTNILQRACHGERKLSLNCSIAPLDMRTAMYPYGRPEKQICNVAMAQMARRYGASYVAHGGHADAKRPSVEAGYQRAASTIPALMTCGRAKVGCGLLSVDEVFSPVQMILDDEFVGAMRRFARGFQITEESLAVDLIDEVGPGGAFIDRDHTLRHFRDELWEPRLFSRTMFGAWRQEGSRTAEDLALDRYYEILDLEPIPSKITEALDAELVKILRRAASLDMGPVDGEGNGARRES